MTMKLNDLVGYLAGREGDPRLLEELADPASDASLFLEATRNRSQLLVPETSPEPKPSLSRPKLSLRQVWIALAILVSTLIICIFLELRVRHLESIQVRTNAENRMQSQRLETILSGLAERQSSELHFEGIQRELTRIAKQVEGMNRLAPQPLVDPVFNELQESLAALRREVATFEKGASRQSEELRASSLEMARLLRLLISRTQPSTTTPESPAEFPVPRRQ